MISPFLCAIHQTSFSAVDEPMEPKPIAKSVHQIHEIAISSQIINPQNVIPGNYPQD
jgi:hypothetical protein